MIKSALLGHKLANRSVSRVIVTRRCYPHEPVVTSSAFKAYYTDDRYADLTNTVVGIFK